MDQLTQGAPAPVPPSPSPQPGPQPGPQQIPPAVAPQVPPPVSVPPAPTPVQPASTQPVDVAPAAPSKLKNPKLWIGAGVLILVVVIGSAIFLGKPPLLPGRSRRSAAEVCPPLIEAQCRGVAAKNGTCEWVDNVCRAVVLPEPPPPEPPPPPAPEPAPITDPRTRVSAANVAARTARATAATAATAAGVAAEEANTEVARTAATEARTAADAANIASNEIIILLRSFNNRTTAEAAGDLATEAEIRLGRAEDARDQAVAAQGRAETERDRVVAAAGAAGEAEPPLQAEDLEATRGAALESAGPLVVAAGAAATEANEQVKEGNIEKANIEAAISAANDAKAAAEAAKVAFETIKDAQTSEEIQRALADVQASHDTAVQKLTVVTALVADAAARVAAENRAAEDAARYARERTQAAEAAQAAQARAFEQRCESQEKANYNPATRLCTLADGTAVKNLAELEAALADVADEDQKKKDCEDKNKDLKAPEWRWDGKECVGGKVAIVEVPKCPPEKPVFFGNECHKQDELCSTLGAKLTDELKAKKVDPKDIEHAVIEMNSLSSCGFTAAQFLAPFEEEQAKNECAAKDQSVWEWNESEKQCKNKQEGRMRELEELVASLQQQLANAQSSNNSAQINALAQQIATLNSQINELRGAAGEPIVITVVAPPAPAPAPAAPPAAPPSGGGGGGEVVAVAVPEVKKEEKKDSKKKKDKKATSDAASVETAAASAPAVSDSGAAATAPAKIAAAASGATGAKAGAGAGAAGAASVTHGAFIQGRTGPGVLIYPLAVIGANGVYYFLRRRRKK